MADENSLITAIEQHESQAELYGTLSEDRTKSLEYYRGEPMGNEVTGRSQVVSRDVFDTVEWIKPDLAEIFCGGDEVVSFSPKSQEDVKGAEQETDFVNHVITQRNDWFSVFYGWSHDALLQKVGYVKAYWDDSEDETEEKYEGVSEEEYQFLMQDPGVELVEYEEGQQFVAGMVEPIKTYTCTFKRKTGKDVVRLVNVAPENIKVSQHSRNLSLQDPALDFCEHEESKTISQLREEGFEVDDNIADSGKSAGDYEDASRNRYQPFMDMDEGGENDPSMRRVRVREVWIRHDDDGDGKAELLHVIVVGREILLKEKAEFVPIVALCPAPLPHQHYGFSLADAVMDLQQIKTALWRNALDNQYLANNGRYGIDADNVNLDDMLDSRPGGIVRVKGNPGQAIFPLNHPTTGEIAIPMLEYTDRIGMKRTGVNEQTQGLDSHTINKNTPYATTAALMSAAQKRVRFIARIMAETGVKSLFLIVHALTLKHARKAEIVKLRNEFVPVDPRHWVKRQDMTVSVGLGTGDKPQQIAFLEKVFQLQGAVGPHGLASPAKVYNTLSKLTRAAGFKDPGEFWDDPSQKPPEPKQPPPEVLVEQMRQQGKAQSDQMSAQITMQLEQAKGDLSMRQKQAELELQAQNDARDAERERNRAEMDAQIKALDAQYRDQQHQREMDFQRWKAELDAAVKIQVAQVSAQASVQNAATAAAEREVSQEVRP
jgi:hypothetical protein